MDLATRTLLDELFEKLDRASYYELLGVPQDAAAAAIRDAFYARADELHPDRYFHLDQGEDRQRVLAVYKRVAEAYRVLMRAETRATYDEQLRFGQMRFAAEPQRTGSRDPELHIKNLRARRLYQDAKQALLENNLRGAGLALQMAQIIEADNPLITEMQREVEKRKKEQPK